MVVDMAHLQLHTTTMHTRRTREPQLPPMAPLTVRFPVTDLEAMRRLAKRNHRSLNAEIVHAVAEYILHQGVNPEGGEQGQEER